uniref:Uncharacterized protein n=1 Tax=Sphaerodactylus townsendi TaxID=933632 RepID=A0ACB8EEF5_9SAUR
MESSRRLLQLSVFSHLRFVNVKSMEVEFSFALFYSNALCVSFGTFCFHKDHPPQINNFLKLFHTPLGIVMREDHLSIDKSIRNQEEFCGSRTGPIKGWRLMFAIPLWGERMSPWL